ncbi:MAG: DUF1501 domain-containing protein [Hyphomicrobiaceae bacterium]|nr:DUF1501 domain-containing protein [Hyphomicrobiaceae bacterium]
MSCTENHHIDRRGVLRGATASLALWSFLPKAALAGTRDPRLLTMVLRGGLDGLSLAGPVGDPDYVKLRQHIAMNKAGETNGGLKLDDMFVLNPNMPFLHGLYQKRQAMVVHAVHSPYRERSHFDGQDVLESGLPGVGKGGDDGWLNRALAGMPHAGKASPKGLAMGAVVPLVIRGKAPVLSWIPKVYNLPLRDATVARLVDLYGQTDPVLAKALADGIAIDMQAQAMTASVPAAAGQGPPQVTTASGAPLNPQLFREFTEAAETAAKFMLQADGPRIGALSYNGWDTHANEGVIQGALGNRLSGLDQAIKALHDGLGETWKDTIVVIVTEFGRTARVNGTSGTDHGMATCALLVGGAVKGGRVLADWPGLNEASLYQNRDLKPTTDLRVVLKGILRDHLGIPDGALGSSVFPETALLKGLSDLVT